MLRQRMAASERGFSLIELLIVCAILLIVLGSAVNYVAVATQRSRSEQTKVDLTEEAREFVDEFERDIHQAGYPGCQIFNTGANCAARFTKSAMAVGLASVSNTQLIFEGDMNGDGLVESVQYRLVDSGGNSPPSTTCPCTMQRSEVTKADGTAPLAQATNFTQELQNVVNSGVPAAGQVYGNGLDISGNVLFRGGTLTNTQYYAAVTTFKDFPVFSAYDQNGAVVAVPTDISTPAGQQTLATIKSLRVTLNLLASDTAGYDTKTLARPVMTLVGNGRINSN